MLQQELDKIIEQHPILTPEETLELFTKYDRDDYKLTELMYFHNIKLVIGLIHKAGFETEDGLSECWIATSRAVSTWKIEGGAKFSTHLAWSIRGKLGNLRHHAGRGERLSGGLSLDMELLDGEGSTMHDLVASNAPEPSYNIESFETNKVLYRNIEDLLNDREKFVILESISGRTQRDIAKERGTSHQAVSLIHQRAVKKLQEHYKVDRKYEQKER